MATLYEEHRTTVLAVCRGLLRDHVEAEDAAQQTFLSAQRALANGSVPRDPVAWLVTIARHECIARVRGRMREALPTADEPTGFGPDAHAAAVSREEVGHLRDALASLPAQQRDAILLRELRGLSYDEVAASLAVSTSAVESLLFRARRGLQLRLREVAAALSPVGWVGPLRDLGARLIGGGAAAPLAAKAVAVGLGTAVVAGGVVEAPRVIGLGHATRHLSGRAATSPSTQAATSPPLVFAATPTGSGGGQAAAPPHVFAVPGEGEGDGRGATGGGDQGVRGGESGDRGSGASAFASGEGESAAQTGHDGQTSGHSESGDGQAQSGGSHDGGGQDGQTQAGQTQDGQTQQGSPSQGGQTEGGQQQQQSQYDNMLTATSTGPAASPTDTAGGATSAVTTTTDGGATGTTDVGGDG